MSRIRIRLASVTVVALVASAATLAIASPALAGPKGIFARFAQCPTNVPGVTLCSYAETTGGEVAIGKTSVPIEKTIILQGGAIGTGVNNEYFLIPAKNGESLSKAEQNVPGGLADIVNCKEIKGEGLWEKIERGSCEAIFENKVTGVTATTELVANEHNPAILDTISLLFEEETALVLPIRVHLKNPLLGENCYIGSEASPIELRLTTGATSPPGPNKSIHGKFGEGSEETEGSGPGVAVVKNNTLVDNSFSVPVAEGCGGFFSFLIDPLVDLKLGLESKGGNNTAILNGTLRTTTAGAVVESEK
jgi:hypothetical protein